MDGERGGVAFVLEGFDYAYGSIVCEDDDDDYFKKFKEKQMFLPLSIGFRSQLMSYFGTHVRHNFSEYLSALYAKDMNELKKFVSRTYLF